MNVVKFPRKSGTHFHFLETVGMKNATPSGKAINIDKVYALIISEQGYTIGRPGKVYVKVEILNNKPIKVRVGGRAVITLKGWMRID